MIKKYFSILLFGISTTISAQSITDTAKYYLSVSKYTKEIEYCVNEFQKWNEANATNKDAMVMIKTSLDNEGQLTLFVEQAWNVPIDANMPDYYSYIRGVPVFWYMGKSCLSSADDGFREFILKRFSTFFYEYKKKAPVVAPQQITKEEFEKLPFYKGDEEPSPYHGKIVYYPSFVIYTEGGIPKRSGGRTVRIDRVERNIWK